MKDIFYRWIIFVVLFCGSFTGVWGQDSTGRLVDRVHPDSTHHVVSDSLRRDLRALELGYLDNLHIREINTVVNELAVKSDAQIKRKKNASKDSVLHINRLIHDDNVQLNSILNSLNNYRGSILGSRSSVQSLIQKYQINEQKFPRLSTRLNTSLNQLTTKLDSIQAASAKVNALIARNESQLKDVASTAQEIVATDSVKSSNSIWKSTSQNISRETIINNIKNNYQNTNAFGRYFKDIPWSSRILLLLLTIAYAYWCFRTRFDIDRKSGKTLSKIWIAKVVCKAIIFYFTLLPLVSLFTPTFVIQAAQIVIIIFYTALSFNKLSLTQRKVLGVIILFYILDVFVNMIVSDDMFLRIICIVFNLLALGMVSYSKKRIRDKDSAGYINNFIYVIFAILNVTAIILNIIGKVDAFRSFSIACAVGLVQSFTLQFFIEMIREDLQRQFDRDNLYRGFWLRFNQARTMKIIIEVVRFICVILAVLVLANNLQFIDELVRFSESVLEKKRHIGDISFTFNHLIVAVILLLVTNWLQKNISLIVLGGENGQLSQVYNQKMTLFPLVRLAIILVGFFFAVSALGMSLDKLTVVIGALSVGIGLGMQNIINNFVSGIILVFDKPFRVGDQIELADKKGRVKEIGIRASVLQTGDGADVIIPNGDLLSGRVVNWTLSHEYSKTSFTIMVDRQANLDEVYKWVKEAAETNPNYLDNLGVSISVQDVSDDMVYLSVVGWVNSASNTGGFKSDVFLHLYKKFEAENLKFYSVAPTKIIQ
ncbi:mechanosensitive ion channel family protein [Sphingobacterium sp. SGL-16]|uniref:mechanosensitive ion channel family protein n=1 Tax=Sphingobacterium sp. SGL-16 TaxID=2710883 RepID=UPI0013ED54ED|nr:mechanosensitive ion channel domain-containing protein [Sphingobacterium sp. SGL-16]NGM72227.1 mechanosensitive ion channel [Sphingobacterium sp. SGL-16]